MKERKISRRAVCSAMVASLALGVLEGCGSSSSTTASSAAGSGAAASNERITVRILKSKAANEVAAEQMDVWKVLGEKFNMDFEFDNPPQDNYNERLNLVMMDAQLPDIIMDKHPSLNPPVKRNERCLSESDDIVRFFCAEISCLLCELQKARADTSAEMPYRMYSLWRSRTVLQYP